MRSSAVALFLLSAVLFFATACSSTTTVVEQSPAKDAGGGGATEDAGTGEPGEPVPFKLTSTAFEEGATLPEAHTCDASAPKSPALAWTAGPEGTKSYALVFTDKTNGLVHSVIYDIPVDTTSMPEKVANTYEPSNLPGAKQTTGYDAKTYGYLGPCPPTGVHTYEFAIYALKVDALPDMTKTSTTKEAVAAITANDLTVAKLTAKYQKK